MKKVDISFVIPAKDEQKNVSLLYKELTFVLRKIGKSYEIIFVDDGSSDRTYGEINSLIKKDSKVKVIKHRGNWGKSIALQNGFIASSGEIIITMDADLQDNPRDIPKFIEKIEKGFDLVVGWKKKRYDPMTKTLPSKIGNFLTRLFTKVSVHDLNCGFKAYKRSVVENLNLYGEMYKYIPVLAEKQNFKVGEVIINHRKRKYGKSKFGWERNLKGLLDLITVVFLTGYLRKPGHFFGTLGAFSFLSGFFIGLYITFLRITTGGIEYRYPLLFLGVLLMVIGVQFVSTGLLAETIIYSSKKIDYKSSIEQ
ncbi:glycosyltransferase family 2 protein [Candidatus Microgenomates bacterium]|nr:glycosyltransferase family 2 protein [Candidatus Microgenomates bacterium]